MTEQISFWKQRLTSFQSGFILGAILTAALLAGIVALALMRGGA